MRKRILSSIIAIILAVSVSGCAVIKDAFKKLKGELIGQQFVISLYDHYANKTMEVTGSKVTVGLLENSANYNQEDTGFKSEVIEVTINGSQMLQVGNTVIFAEKGLDQVENYEAPAQVTAESGGGFVPIDRFVNDIKNQIGKPKTIVISSQMGIPICVYQGNEVYVTVPKDLPKMTRLNIDGKSLYIHRANYVILDSKLLN
jgi:hypothetical protein